MSTLYDERVVEMRFDNKQFESNVKTSLGTLDRLKKSLDLDGAADTFSGLNDAARKVDMSALGHAAEAVSTKFSALETIAVGALLKIGNQAVTAGEQLIKSLTVDNISAGWDKLAKKTTAVGTLVAQGYDMSTVEDQLERLNWFTDETSYNFTDMVESIAKFTASGQTLEGSVTALEGVATWAALSGQNATKASSAMYQLSQAMGAGVMRKEDYKSIQNLSMDTAEFRQKALDAAVALGTLKKNADDTYTSLIDSGGGAFTVNQFADHLTKDAWFTSDVMMKVFNEYSSAVNQIYEYSEEKGITASEAIEELGDKVDQFGLKAFRSAQEAKTWSDVIDSVKDAVSTGWMTTFETIFGNYEEQRVLWTDLANSLYDVFAETGNVRNELLREALSDSGFDKFVKTLKNTGIEIEDYQSKLTEVAQSKNISINDIVTEYGSLEAAIQNGAISYDLIAEAASKFDREIEANGYNLKQFTNGIMLSLTEVDKLSGRQNLVAAFWNTWEGVGALLSTVKEAFRDIFPAKTADQIYNFTVSLNKLTENFKTFLTESEDGQAILTNIKNTFKGVFSVVDIVKQAFDALFRSISPAGSAVGGLLSKILDMTGSFGEWLYNLDQSIKENDIFYNSIQKVIDFIKGAITSVKNFGSAVADMLHLPNLSEAKENIQDFLASIKEKISAPGLDTIHTLLENIRTRARQVKDAIINMKDNIVDSMQKADKAISENKTVQVLTGVWNFVKAVGSVIGNLVGKVFTGISTALGNADFSGILDFLNSLVAGGLLVALKKFLDSMSNFGEVFGSFKDFVSQLGGGVVKILDGVRGSLEAWQTKLKADSLIKISAAVGILAVSLLVLASIDSDKITSSIAAITTLFIELSAAIAVLSNLTTDGKNLGKISSSMVKMSAALLILSIAMKNLGGLNSDQITKGLIGIGVLFAEISVFLKTAHFDKAITKSATGMVIFAAAIKILASAVKDISTLSWGDMAKGLVGVGALLAEIDIFLNTAKFSGKAPLTATGIVLLAAAIKILASAAKDFGAMSVNELIKGLTSVGLILAEIAAFTNLTGNAKHVISTGLAMIEISAAMKIFASVMQKLGGMSWQEIAKGLVSIGLALGEIALTTNLMPKNMVGIGTGLIAVGTALVIISNAIRKMAGMSWEEITKGLVAMGGALAELSIGLNLMNGTLGGSAALLVAAGALLILTPAMKALGNMSWAQIAKGLVTIAGAFAVVGVASAVLSPLVGTILALSAALAIIGVGSVAIGAGLTLIGAGLTSISVGITSLSTALAAGATAIVASLNAIVLGFASVIPAVTVKIGEAVVAFCVAIANSAPALAEAIKTVILSMIDTLTTCIPAIAEGAMLLIIGVLDALVTYTPRIVDAIMQFIVEVLEGIGRNVPQLIQAAISIVGSFFSGLLDALGEIDIDTLIKGLGAIGLLTGIVAALGAVAGLVPAAMIGVLGVGAVITELAIVLAAIGGLAQIPGLEWLISEGGELLQKIGTAIGQFAGGIVGGFMGGVTSSFPKIGEDLSAFMTNAQPFIDGASRISSDLLSGVANLTGAILLITAADLIEGITSWLTGGSSLTNFGNELVIFGLAMVAFSDTISGLDVDNVGKAAVAGKTLAEMAAVLPKSGGVFGFFTGNSDMTEFGTQLVAFGSAMTEFSISVANLETEAVQNAAIAGKALAEMASTIPNSGGVVDFFVGRNDLSEFGSQLVPFGKAMKEYSDAVTGLNTDTIANSVTVGESLVALADTIPNTGGVLAFFTGDNDLATFAEQLVPFGKAIKEYSNAVTGLNADTVENSVTAGEALVALADTIPNTGGFVDLFTGKNDLGTFAEGLVPFGKAMKDYSDSLNGFNSGAVISSASAGEALVALADTIPNTGGFVDLFTGKNDLGTFAEGLVPFGKAMKEYSDAVTGLNADTVISSTSAGEALAALADRIPNSGGFISLFTGNTDFGAFAEGLVPFGMAMKGYSDAVTGLNADIVIASVSAGEALASLADTIPNVGGFVDFFTGKNDLGTFAKGLVPFGMAMKKYSDAVTGLNADTVTNSVTAGQALVALANTVPNTGGFIDLFTGKNDFGTFAEQLVLFGTALKEYSDTVADLNVDAVTNSVTVGEALVSLANTSIDDFVSAFSNSHDRITNGVDDMLNAVSEAISNKKSLTSASMEDVMIELSTVVSKKANDITSAVSKMMGAITSAIKGATNPTKSAMANVLSATVSTINSYYNQFYTAGVNAGQGFVNGLNSKLSSASSSGWSLGRAALEAAQRALDSHSPSREFINLGKNVGDGLSIGIKNSTPEATNASSNMAGSVVNAAEKVIEPFDEWIDQKIEHTQNELKKEADSYENVQEKYVAAAKERIKIDQEIYKVESEAAKASYQHSMDWIEKEQYYNRMSLADELAAYKRVQSRYAAGMEEREKMDREVYRVEKEIYEAQKQYVEDVQKVQENAQQKRIDLEEEYADKVKSINEKLESDIKNLNDQYINALDSRTDSLYKAYNLFDKIGERDDISGTTLIDNLQGQVEEFSEWQRTLDSLSARGVDSGLISELSEMGPSTISQIKALEKLSDSELDRYVGLWKVKHALAREQAVDELEGLRVETQNGIAQLRIDAERELEEYRAQWQTKMRQIDIDTNAELDRLRRDFGEKVGLIKKDTEFELREMAEISQAILVEAGWDDTGHQIVAGLSQGVRDEQPVFINTLTQMALSGADAVRNTLDIRSPSRVFREIGNYTGLGFIKGIADYAQKSYEAGSSVANEAKSGLSDAMKSISDYLNGDMSVQPTIRPVMDLSDVANGVRTIDDMFYSRQLLALAGQTSMGFSMNGENQSVSVNVDNSGIIQEIRTLRGEMAEMADRITKMQFVLDTGTLVGEMVDGIDSALGQRQVHRGRGN